MAKELLDQLKSTYRELRDKMRADHARRVPFGDLIADRWETAQAYGFGENASCYDNVLIIGDVRVGKQSWIGPNVILDGRGGLEIGDYVSISAGVHIYSHDTVDWSTSMGREPEARSPTRIGSGVYIGPQTVIEKGVTIGDRAVVGAMSLVKADVPAGSRAWGIPAVVQPPNGRSGEA